MGALSGKTGFTAQAGYCYVGAVKQDDRCFIVALLACGWPNDKNYKSSDTRKLMEYGLENYTYRDVFDNSFQGTVVKVENGQYENYPEEGEASAELTLNLPEESRHLKMLLRQDEQVGSQLPAPRVTRSAGDGGNGSRQGGLQPGWRASGVLSGLHRSECGTD